MATGGAYTLFSHFHTESSAVQSCSAMAPRGAELTAAAADESASRGSAHCAVAQTQLALSVCALGFPSLRGRWTEWRPSEESQSTSRKQEGISVLRRKATVSRINADRHLQGVTERARSESLVQYRCGRLSWRSRSILGPSYDTSASLTPQHRA